MRHRQIRHALSIVLLAATATLLVAAATKESAPKKEGKTDAIVVNIIDLSFRPDSVTIKVGETIRWTNNDDRDHIIMARDQSFKSGNLRPKEKFEHTFTDAGTFEYGCVYRPRMTGTIVVEKK